MYRPVNQVVAATHAEVQIQDPCCGGLPVCFHLQACPILSDAVVGDSKLYTFHLSFQEFRSLLQGRPAIQGLQNYLLRLLLLSSGPGWKLDVEAHYEAEGKHTEHQVACDMNFSSEDAVANEEIYLHTNDTNEHMPRWSTTGIIADISRHNKPRLAPRCVAWGLESGLTPSSLYKLPACRS